MKIGIISDTHDQLERIQKAIDFFNREAVDKVYHLGDWCSPFSVAVFSELKCPIIGIFGNNDADIFKHLSVKPQNLTLQDRVYVDHVMGRKIVLFHGDPMENVTALVNSGAYDAVLHGHNHVANISRHNNLTLINPGSLVGPFGRWQNWTKPSVALYWPQTNEGKIVLLDP